VSLWQRVRQTLACLTHPLAGSQRTRQNAAGYHFNASLLHSLNILAEREGRTEDQVADELLKQALFRRKAAESRLHNWELLSPREQQVAALVCLNLTNQEIANYLGISPETAKCHVRGVLVKFGLPRRSDLRLALADWDFSVWLT
jgi:DNA-binding CsgD family transcriptional regulator